MTFVHGPAEEPPLGFESRVVGQIVVDALEGLVGVGEVLAADTLDGDRRVLVGVVVGNVDHEPVVGALAGILRRQRCTAALTGAGARVSETADGQILLSATWGLGSAIAQGQVVPDRIVLSRLGFVRTIEADADR